MRTVRRSVPLGRLLVAVVGLVACGSSTGTASGAGGTVADLPRDGVATGPSPAEMCPGSAESPSVAAYDLRTGAYRWSVCTGGDARYSVRSVADGVVTVVRQDALDPGAVTVDGYALADGAARAPASAPATTVPSGPSGDGPATAGVFDGVRVTGGQDDPTEGHDADSGERLWSRPGTWAYDDVWAIGDGAVYAVDARTGPPVLQAYELRTGAVRWERTTADLGYAWPYLADRGIVFVLWTNLALLSTADGAVIWRTTFPDAAFPRITGVGTDGGTVVVAFSTVASGGD